MEILVIHRTARFPRNLKWATHETLLVRYQAVFGEEKPLLDIAGRREPRNSNMVTLALNINI